ncbi:MAG: BrnT family toxin [Variovorax sp.]
MQVPFDPVKRAKTLSERGLDFADAALVFEGDTLEVEDDRRDYGEVRVICFGLLEERMVVVGYTPRGADRHIFSMRKANEREQERIGPQLGLWSGKGGCPQGGRIGI